MAEAAAEVTANDTWCLYIIGNEIGHSYVGITKGEGPERRLAEHNAGTGARRTRGQGPWRLLYVETSIANRSDAQKREWEVKHSKALRRRLAGL